MVVTEMAKTATNILKLSSTPFVSNIRHHHQCSPLALITVKNAISSDVGLALIKYNPTFKKMNQKDKSQFLDEFEGKNSRIQVKFMLKSVRFSRSRNWQNSPLLDKIVQKPM